MIAKSFTADEARTIGEEIGIDWSSAPFDVEQFRMGMDVELEHGLHDPATNVTDDDPLVTGKIALAHPSEFAGYYTRLAKMEADAETSEPSSPSPSCASRSPWPASRPPSARASRVGGVSMPPNRLAGERRR